TPELTNFANTLEQVCIEAVEGGEMTKDLAALISKDTPWQTTEEFLSAIDRRLQEKMA
ncbi:MAG: NADP-dependent isocitrate dehydrogenase, partial [Ilumatobacteraceae bacterium]